MVKNSILDYEKLVYSIISKYSYNQSDLEDLYQVGMMALSNALDHYKNDYNTKFSTYACIYIRGEVLKYIRESRVIKINKDYFKLNRLILKTKEILSQKYMKEATLEEIASFLEIPMEKIIEASCATEYVKSLDYESGCDGKELNLYDSVAYQEPNYSEEILDLNCELEKLEEKERRLLYLRYYEDKSQQQTSTELGMSQVQVSRNETKILKKLRNRLN